MRTLLLNLRRRPLRLFLTFLQILLGSLAMTLALSPYFSPEDTGSDDTFFLNAGFRDEEGAILYSIFNSSDFQTLKSLAPDVEDIAIYQAGWNAANVVYEGKRFSFNVGATATVDLNYFDLSPVTMTRGYAFSEADERAQEAVVLLSDSSAQQMFGDVDPIGKTILKTPSHNFYERDSLDDDPVPYRVVGTFAETTNVLYTTPAIYYPVWAPESFSGVWAYQVLVKATGGRGDVAQTQLLAAARQHYKNDPMMQGVEVGEDFFISKRAEFQNDEAPFNPNLIILAMFGIISLIIGSIGMFSTTLIDILERAHDVGIKRALGASWLDVCREVSTGTALLAFIGAAAGALCAALIVSLLQNPLGTTFSFGLPFSWQPLAALLVTLMTVLLGVLVGFFPAFTMMRTNPIEALKKKV